MELSNAFPITKYLYYLSNYFILIEGATGMKKLFSIGLVLFFVAGCGTSAQDKRNNYDACLIEEEVRYKQQMKDQYPNLSNATLQDFADQQDFPSWCVDLLK